MSGRRIASAVLFATIVGLGVWLRWTTPDLAQDLRPRPDALEYEEGARSLLRGEGYHVRVDGERYVPRYPFGFSVLLAPALAVWDVGPGSGVAMVLLTAAGAIAGAWALGIVAGGIPGAIVAASIVAFSPLHARWSTTVMSDVPSSCGVAWLAYAALVSLRRRRGPVAWALVGLGLGFLATIRMSNGLLVPPIVAMLIVARDRSRRERVTSIVALGLGTLAALLPLLVYQAYTFGGPLRTGYGFWAPIVGFAWRFLRDPPEGGGTLPNLWYYARLLAGDGALYGVAVAAMVAVGGVAAARGDSDRRRVLWLGVGFTVLMLWSYGIFFWQEDRYLLPVLPLLAAIAAAGVASTVPVSLRAVAAGLAVLAVVLVARGPSPYGRDKVLHEAEVLREISRRIEPDAVILACSNDHFMSLLVLAPDRRWVPLCLDDHRFAVRWHKIAPDIPDPAARARIDQAFAGKFDPVTATLALDRLVASGRPVYLSTLLSFKVEFMPALVLLAAQRFHAERVATIQRTSLFRLRPN
ncbi:MAG TPA: glycosyltransferase family 39 protein [Candidatus Binatia bacterium]|nr:glycosyltransferase family 39 protein [Candidatus Binatia bacterium]